MRAARGFTLLEMTMVLLLLGLMSTIVFGALRFGARAYRHTVAVDDANWQLCMAQRFLRTLLGSALPLDPERFGRQHFGLEGTQRRLSFTVASTLQRYTFELTAANSTAAANLIVRWQRDHDARAPALITEGSEVLVDNVAGIAWSYAAAGCGAGTAIRWQPTWQARRELPALVRLQITFAERDPRQWPELVVAPRITDDTLSWIDAVNMDPACDSGT
jgi:general secretion pathway protein J